MKELEVRFALNKNEEEYIKILEYLEKNYSFKENVYQNDRYFKEYGKEMEKEIQGSYIYRIRKENDKYIFTRKDTIAPGLWDEHEIILEGDEAEFLKNVLKSGFNNVLTINKLRKTYKKNQKTINLDKIDGLGIYLEIELLGEFSQKDIELYKKNIAEEFFFIKPKIENKGYVQLMRELNESDGNA
ncbi:CYTH domain-containing protein [Leptotrichia sp. OH3620_COT-345]|uniref:CYTH domain-containing protein n=1 Tax=Leptotrichia sp. OH3620_COT-345 TaxID=2491048 RepID=UPI000F64AE4F|nr:CYTH domain-containing protein [Leptotrichia sp. OH3620_COT-345]RRD39354.1 CYTH domain-containing protein [Leptotrichia sp. OH3620_COT-345]